MALEQHWVYKFHDQIHLTYQQTQNLLGGTIDPSMINRDVRGAIDHHERMGAVIASDVVSPYAPVVPTVPESSKRAVTLVSTQAIVLVADEDKLRSLADPQNALTQTIVNAHKRREDKWIIDAALGSAQIALVTAGTGVITYSSLALPSARKIGAATAIDLARIINAAELLSKSGVPTGPNERTFVYAPGQLRNIMAITQASSSDFTRNMLHDRGTINGVAWEGFNWVEIPDVMATDGSTVLGRMIPLTSTTRNCFAFHRGAIGISSAKDMTTVIDPRPDLQARPLQVRTSMIMAAVRVWEGGVVQVDCLEN